MNETFRVPLTPSMARKIARLAHTMPRVEIDPLILEIAQLSQVDEDYTYDLTEQQKRLVQDLLDFDLRAVVVVSTEGHDSDLTRISFQHRSWIAPIIRAASLSGIEHFIVSSSYDKDEICRSIYHHGYSRQQVHIRSRLTPNALDDLYEYRGNGLLLVCNESQFEYPPAAMEFPRTVVVSPYWIAKRMAQFSSMPSMNYLADDVRLRTNLGFSARSNDLAPVFNTHIFNASVIMMGGGDHDEEKI